MICFGICGYASSKIEKGLRREQAQKAEFMDFLYTYHKQMADEEDQCWAHMSSTPGAP